ncbi:cupin 2 domain-containing protein [Alteromonadaceae bacterium 2753L.S.0a.02]|nr:cupin 2 domain-containing protein [Alteromonadaceae bacterium 2753L.S.0a.02]
MKHTLFGEIPDNLPHEQFQEIIAAKAVRIERILSRGHSSPATGWYDQAEHEWVILLQGAARLGFCTGETLDLKPGDYVNIPAHCKHKVTWTDPEQTSVWLAVFYSD